MKVDYGKRKITDTINDQSLNLFTDNKCGIHAIFIFILFFVFLVFTYQTKEE